MSDNFFNFRVRKSLLVAFSVALGSKLLATYGLIHDLDVQQKAAQQQIDQLREAKCPTK